jgi:type II secretory pathway pseudopilin PulG
MPILHRNKNKAKTGFTLMEAAIVIAVLGLMSIGFSNLFFTAVDTQNNQAIHVHEQSILTTIISQIRADVLTASSLTPANANNSLIITPQVGPAIRYDFAGGTLSRTITGNPTFDYLSLLPATMRANHTITCGGSGFACLEVLQGRRVSIRFLRVRDTSALSGPFEAAFNRKAQFMVSEASFNTLMGYTFN